MLPTPEQIKQFFVLTILPVLSGSAATWLVVHLHFLAAFHLAVSSVAGELTQFGVWGITAALSWLASHNILKAVYSPAAKAKVGS